MIGRYRSVSNHSHNAARTQTLLVCSNEISDSKTLATNSRTKTKLRIHEAGYVQEDLISTTVLSLGQSQTGFSDETRPKAY